MGNNLQKIILYLTINTENLKFYVGLHECDPDVYDYYLGDGCYANDPSTYNRRKLPLAFAIRSNGVSKFKRIILGVYDNMKDAEKAEKAIVTEDFVKRTDNYNTIAKSKSKSVKKSTNPNTIKQWSKTGELINEFTSVEEASEKLDIPKRTIVNSLFRRGSKSGYYFTNPNEDFSDIKNKSKIDFSTFYCYDDKGYVCKEYHDLQEAMNDTGAKLNALKRAIFKEKKYKHLRWSLKKYENIFRKHCRPVAQYDVDGNLIKRYRSINECRKSFPNVLDVLNGEIDSIDGYIFKFVS